MMINNGNNQQSRPSLGSWLTYGLGTVNQNLPGFVVLCPGTPVMGPPLWNSVMRVSQHFYSLAQEYPVQSRLVRLLRLVGVD